MGITAKAANQLRDTYLVRAEKAERELEALLSFSEGREHKCDDACSWAHSEYVKFIFKEARGELETVECELTTARLSTKAAKALWITRERERDEARAKLTAIEALVERQKRDHKATHCPPCDEFLDELEAVLRR